MARRGAARKPQDEAGKTAEQMVLRNKITPAEPTSGPGSIVVNTVQKIVSRETKPAAGSPAVARRHPLQHGCRTPDAPKDDASGRPLNKYASKKLRMKRANTIDLPKVLPSAQLDDGEDGRADPAREPARSQQAHQRAAGKLGPATVPPVDVPDFKPRTENDLKFMAFLQKQNQQSRQVWSKPLRESHGSNNYSPVFFFQSLRHFILL